MPQDSRRKGRGHCCEAEKAYHHHGRVVGRRKNVMDDSTKHVSLDGRSDDS